MHINPDLMDQQQEKKPNKYKKRTAAPEPVIQPQFEVEYEDEVTFQAPPMREYNNPIQSEEEEVAPGLYKSDILSWKKQYEKVYSMKVKGRLFVVRPLSRFEYKEIISVPNSDPLMREEMMCEYCVLYPQGYNFASMANDNAGIPAVLAEAIMEYSGFTRDVEVVEL